MNKKQNESADLQFTSDMICPYCGHSGIMRVYPLIETDEAMRERICSGDLFIYHCPECGKSTAVNYPLRYIDREKGIMIENISEELDPRNPEEEGSDFVIRRTENIYDFQEKVRIFEDQRDDRIIELLKAIMRRDLEDRGIACDKLYYVPEDQYKGIHLLSRDYVIHCFVEMCMYESAKSAPFLPEFRTDSVEVVDEEYGEQLRVLIEGPDEKTSMLS